MKTIKIKILNVPKTEVISSTLSSRRKAMDVGGCGEKGDLETFKSEGFRELKERKEMAHGQPRQHHNMKLTSFFFHVELSVSLRSSKLG
ncbi:hypothetical protein M5K25_002145 [Dendrobium thyrsiflorum]|uniref:Uncharacterized protein n=1 Tax=Dendrobium thyrsiflorum TaxID=117978 RepID=A0ABD0W2X4_DENTH